MERGDVPQEKTLARLEEWVERDGLAEESAEDAVHGGEGGPLEQLLETMDATARFMTQLGGPGSGRLQKLGVLNGIREIIVESGKPVPAWWRELREKVESGAL